MKHLAVSLIAIPLLSSCTMVPDYMRPELSVSDKWNTEKIETAKGGKSVTEIAWQEFFQSPGIQSVVSKALEHNKDLKIAALNVEASRELYQISRADLFPSVEAGTGYSRQKVTEAQSTSNPLFGSGREYITSTYSANVASSNFEIDLFGKVRSQNAAALEDFFAMEAARDATQIALIAEVSNAYLQWQADRKILALAEETLDAQEKSFNLISESHKNGVATQLDLAQVSQAVESAKATKALYTRRVKQDMNALLLLLGTKSIDNSLERYHLEDTELLKYLPVQLPSEVLLKRPDIRQAEHELKSANVDIGVARATFFPTISLTGSYGFASSELDNLFTGAAAGAWGFAPQISAPIFEGGRNIANLKYSRARKKALVAQYEKAVQTAFKEVSDELAARETLEEELQAQSDLVKAAQQAYDISYARYKEGIDNFLAVLDAQRTLFAAQQREIEVEKQYYANLVNLYKVLGGGLSDKKHEKASIKKSPDTPEEPKEFLHL